MSERWARTVLGGVSLLALGVLATVWLWTRGWAWRLTFTVAGAGVLILIDGLVARAREARGLRQGPRVRRDYARLLDGLQRSGTGRAERLRWLRESGITHRKLSRFLLDRVAVADGPRPGADRDVTTVIPAFAQGRDTTFPPIRDLVGTAHPLEEGDLARFEARHGLRLPVPYQRFLLRYNGGVLKPDWFPYASGEAHVRAFCGLGTGGSRDLDAMVRAHARGAGPDGPRLLPIAVTTDEAIVGLVVDEADHGAVYLRPRGAAPATRIADDFFTFLRSITWEPGTEPPPAPKRRSRR